MVKLVKKVEKKVFGKVLVPLDALAEVVVAGDTNRSFASGRMRQAFEKLINNPDASGTLFHERYPDLFPGEDVEELVTDKSITRTQRMPDGKGGWTSKKVKIPAYARKTRPSKAEVKRVAKGFEDFLANIELLEKATAKGTEVYKLDKGISFLGVQVEDTGSAYPGKYKQEWALQEMLKKERFHGWGGDVTENMKHHVLEELTDRVEQLNRGELGKFRKESTGIVPQKGSFGDPAIDTSDIEGKALESQPGRPAISSEVQKPGATLIPKVTSTEVVPYAGEEITREIGEFEPGAKPHDVPKEGKVKPIQVKRKAIIGFKEAHIYVMENINKVDAYGNPVLPRGRSYLQNIQHYIMENQPKAGADNITNKEIRVIAHKLEDLGELKPDPTMTRRPKDKAPMVDSELHNRKVARDLYPTTAAMREQAKTGEPFKKSLPVTDRDFMMITPDVVDEKKSSSMLGRSGKGLGRYKIGLKGAGPLINLLAGAGGAGYALYKGMGFGDAAHAGIRSVLDPSSPVGVGSDKPPTGEEMKTRRKEYYEHNMIMKENPGLDLGDPNTMVHDVFSPPDIEKMLQEAEVKQANGERGKKHPIDVYFTSPAAKAAGAPQPPE